MQLLLAAWLLLAQAPAPADLDEALLTAARKGDLEQVKALLAKGANLEAKTRHGVTPLYYAASRGHADVLNYLIEKGANINVEDTFYKSNALDFAIQNGNTATAKILVEKGCKFAPKALGDAVGKGDVELVKVILDKSKPTEQDLTAALTTAEKDKKTEIVELLKKGGAKPMASVEVDPALLAKYAGTYKHDTYGDMTVVLKENKLVLNAMGQQMELSAKDERTFTPPQFPQLTLQFQMEDGKPKAVKINQGNFEGMFTRVEKN